MMAIPGGLHVAYLVGLLCVSLGLFLHLLGLVTDQWALQDGDPIIYYSLWETCVGDVCMEHPADFSTDSLKVTQAFGIVGMVTGVSTLILGIVYALMAILKKTPHRVVTLVAMITGAFSFVTINICVVTWSGGMPMRNETRNGYSLVVSILGSLFITTGGVLVFLGSG